MVDRTKVPSMMVTSYYFAIVKHRRSEGTR